MSQVCCITGKHPGIGHTVSHANKKAKRRFNINLQSKRFWLASEHRYVKLRVSTKGIRMIDKLGLETILDNPNKYFIN